MTPAAATAILACATARLGSGKTLSARYYARWDVVEARTRLIIRRPIPRELGRVAHAALYPGGDEHPALGQTTELADSRITLKGVVDRAGHPAGDHGGPPCHDRCELIIVDEADRLKMQAWKPCVICMIGGVWADPDRHARPGKAVGALSPALFAYRLCACLPTPEPGGNDFILQHHWAELGRELEPTQFTDQEAVAAMIRITAGNFRLLHRLLTQIGRILKVNELQTITQEIVEAARACLVIGTT